MDISVVGGVRRSVRIVILLAAVALVATFLGGTPATPSAAGHLDVIVTAADGLVATAANAVESAGGTVER